MEGSSMEMISATAYIEEFKNKSIKELLKEKNNLLKTISNLENRTLPLWIDASVELLINQNREYLQKIEELIKLKEEANNE